MDRTPDETSVQISGKGAPLPSNRPHYNHECAPKVLYLTFGAHSYAPQPIFLVLITLFFIIKTELFRNFAPFEKEVLKRMDFKTT